MNVERIRLYTLVIVLYLLPVLVVVALEVTRSKETAVLMSKQSLSYLISSRAEELNETLQHGVQFTDYLATDDIWADRIADHHASDSLDDLTSTQDSLSLSATAGNQLVPIAIDVAAAKDNHSRIPGDPASLVHIPYPGDKAALEYLAFVQGDVFAQYAAPFRDNQVLRYVIRDSRIGALLTTPVGSREEGTTMLVASGPFQDQVVLPGADLPIPQLRKDPTFPLSGLGLWRLLRTEAGATWVNDTWNDVDTAMTWAHLSIPGLYLVYLAPQASLETTTTAPITYSFIIASLIGLVLTIFLIFTFSARYTRLYNDYSKTYYQITRNANVDLTVDDVDPSGNDLEDFRRLLRRTLTELKERIEKTQSDRERLRQEKEATERAFERASSSIASTEMASYIAHNVNQPLTEMKLMIEYNLENKTDFAVPFSEDDVQELLGHINRIANIILDMRRISTSKRAALENVPVRQIIDQSSRTTNRRVQEAGIAFDYSGVPNVVVKADPIGVEQVLFNLVNNAIDAIVSADDHERARTIRITGEVRQGRCYLSVADSGQGMPPEVLEKVRTPGFSTKGTMGVGVSSVVVTVGNHGGEVIFETTEGQGITVTFDLPIGNDEILGNRAAN